MVLWPVRWFGFAGVDLFFALSGFIITWAHLRDLGRPGKLPPYLFRRAWRIYPPFWAALVSAAALSYLTAGHPVFTPGGRPTGCTGRCSCPGSRGVGWSRSPGASSTS